MSKIWIGVGVAVVIVIAAVGFYISTPEQAQTPAPAPTASTDNPATVSDVELSPDDRIFGDAAAPVTIIEYASLTCPHCASFHAQAWPAIKAKYVDTGQVKLVFRDFPLDQLALRAAGLARCAEGDRYFGFIDVLMQSQRSWGGAPDPIAALTQIGKVGGLSEEEVAKCLNDDSILDKVVEERLGGEQKFGVRSTPTFVVGGQVYRGALTAEQMSEILAPLLP